MNLQSALGRIVTADYTLRNMHEIGLAGWVIDLTRGFAAFRPMKVPGPGVHCQADQQHRDLLMGTGDQSKLAI